MNESARTQALETRMHCAENRQERLEEMLFRIWDIVEAHIDGKVSPPRGDAALRLVK